MRRGQQRVITQEMRRALALAEIEAGHWADARIPGAGHRHMLDPSTGVHAEQALLVEKVERLKERLRTR